MALITVASVPGQAATTVAPLAVALSDTIAGGDIGDRGVLLQVINGSGGSINVTISDPNQTLVGNPGTTSAQAVAAGTDRWFRILPAHVNQSTGVATVAYSAITTVTYKALRA